MHESDVALIKAWQQEDEEAVRTVFTSYFPRAVHLAQLSGLSLPAAQDCAQEAFILAFRKRHQLRKPEAFSFWFYRIVTRHVLASRELQRREKEISLEASGQLTESWMTDQHLQPEEIVLTDEVRSHLWQQIQLLPPTYRLVLALHYSDDFSIREIAQMLTKSEINVRVILHRALKQLRLLSSETDAPCAPVLPLAYPLTLGN